MKLLALCIIWGMVCTVYDWPWQISMFGGFIIGLMCVRRP